MDNTDYNAPVGIEVPDERLAEVEAAKMSGNALGTVGTNGDQIAARHIVAEASQDSMDEGTSTENNMPDYLVELNEGVDDVLELNEAKAASHSEVSAELVRQKQDADKKAREAIAKDPTAVAREIMARQQAQAEEYTNEMAEFERGRMKAEGLFNKELRLISEEEAFSGFAVTELGKRAKDVKAGIVERQQLVEKDSIIFGAKDFNENAKSQIEPDEAPVGVARNSERKSSGAVKQSSPKAEAAKRIEPRQVDAEVEAPKEG